MITYRESGKGMETLDAATATKKMHVNKEAVRILVQSVGYQEASNQTGIAYGTLRQWANRGNWNAHVPKASTIPHLKPVTVVTKSASEAHVTIMQERKQQSATHLSRYICDASEKLANSNGDLKHARPGRDIVAMRSGVWPEEQQGQSGLTLNILNAVIPSDSRCASAHTMDVDASVETD